MASRTGRGKDPWTVQRAQRRWFGLGNVFRDAAARRHARRFPSIGATTRVRVTRSGKIACLELLVFSPFSHLSHSRSARQPSSLHQPCIPHFLFPFSNVPAPFFQCFRAIPLSEAVRAASTVFYRKQFLANFRSFFDIREKHHVDTHKSSNIFI